MRAARHGAPPFRLNGAAVSTRSGYIAIIGRPNVGKSTLLNRFVGEKIAAVSPKPQTTRHRILGVCTQDGAQAVFIDTPGMGPARHKLGSYMARVAQAALAEADIVVWVCDPSRILPPDEKKIIEALKKINAPVYLIINKTDTVDKRKLLPIIDTYRRVYSFKEIFPVSALGNDQIDALMASLFAGLPEGPFYYPEDTLTDQPERTLLAEIMREKALAYMQEEIPHGLAVEVTDMKTRKGARQVVDANVVFYCEKESHKAMLIGKDGAMLKKIASAARRDAQKQLGTALNLTTWVKVKKNWRNDEAQLRHLGYGPGN
jgi:GTP-binding protein Era